MEKRKNYPGGFSTYEVYDGANCKTADICFTADSCKIRYVDNASLTEALRIAGEKAAFIGMGLFSVEALRISSWK